jgi:galactose-1-phosphate uridylyltransferase
MQLRRQVIERTILDPRADFAPTRATLEIREDPLTGLASRILVGQGPLLPRPDFDLDALAERTRATCPFCAERIDQVTPRFPPELVEDGRIRRGEAVLFPNLLAYAAYASVSVYGPDRHHLPLDAMTPTLVADSLATHVAFGRAVLRFDPGARWASINVNHMPPAGSGVFHPHTQGTMHPAPTNEQARLVAVPAERFRDYLATERAVGIRFLGSSGRVDWLAAFAPAGPGELRAFVSGVASPVELDDDLVAELGWGIATAMGLYAEMGHTSFNLAVYGAPPGTSGYPLTLRMVLRSNVAPLYRSDVTWLERLHVETATDLLPEDLAERAGGRFTRGRGGSASL